MSFISDFWQGLESRALDLKNIDDWKDLQGWWPTTNSGVSVSTEGALRYSAVFACVRILAGTMAQMPLIVYQRRQDGGRDRASDFYLYDILHNRPNPFMTSFNLRSTLQGHLALWGNAYAEIEWSNSGKVIGLWPLRPDKVEAIHTNKATRSLLYDYRLPDGKKVTLPQRRMLHLRFMSPNGIEGYSPIRLHRQGIGLAMAAEEFGSRFFGNDARPGVVLKHPGVLGDTAHKHLKESWEARHQGLSKSHRVAILEEGLELQEIGIPPEDAQYLQVRGFQRTEIYGIYGIPPHMAGDVDGSTSWGTGIEQQSIGFVVHTMGPWLSCWEQGLDTSLLTEAERQQYYTEFLVNGLLRGDSGARAQFYNTMFQIGAYSQNDIRRLENENPIEGGDTYFVPMNMMPSDQAGQGFDFFGGDGNERRLEPVVERVAEPDKEERAVRAAYSRQRLQRAHMRVYADVAARVLRREANDVGNAARRMLEQRTIEEFERWLHEFYLEHQDFVATNMRPVAQAYAELVLADVTAEVGGEVSEERLTAFVDAYVTQQGIRHARRNEARIRDMLVEGAEALADDVLEEVERWREIDLAQSLALEESVRAGNAVAHFGYVALGVTMLQSVAVGKSCPYCDALNGRVISITENFLTAGQSFKPDGAETPLTVSRNMAHPPFHAACDCVVVAVTGGT